MTSRPQSSSSAILIIVGTLILATFIVSVKIIMWL